MPHLVPVWTPPESDATLSHVDGEAEPYVVVARRRLRALGQRATPARLSVLAVLAGTDEHLGAAEIADRSAAGDPGVHRATVYRALATLCELGLVSHTHTSGAGAVYHLSRPVAEPHGTHVHLECTVCHQLTDVPAALLEPLARSLAEEHAFTLEPTHATLLGVCARCRDAGGTVRS
jgi:Fur family ferric uptake transcriptional regulator